MPKFSPKTSHRGFTLIEMLLAISIIGVLAGLSAPVVIRLQQSNDLDQATKTTVRALRRAQELARASDGDITWGVHLSSGTVALYQGASYMARTDEEDTAISTAVGLSGVSDILFAKADGLPQTTGSLILSNNNDSRTINVNSMGMVQY